MDTTTVHAVALCRNCEFRTVGTIARALGEKHAFEHRHDVEVTETKTLLLRYR